MINEIEYEIGTKYNMDYDFNQITKRYNLQEMVNQSINQKWIKQDDNDVEWHIQQFVDVAIRVHQSTNKKEYDLNNIELANQYQYLKEIMMLSDQYLDIIIQSINEDLNVDITIFKGDQS